MRSGIWLKVFIDWDYLIGIAIQLKRKIYSLDLYCSAAPSLQEKEQEDEASTREQEWTMFCKDNA